MYAKVADVYKPVFPFLKGRIIDKYTSLLLDMEGEDDGTDFYDRSPHKHSITALGNAKTEDTQKKFGNTSLYCDGTGDGLSGPSNHHSLNLSTYLFTIDLWVYLTEDPPPYQWPICYWTDTNNHWRFIAGGANPAYIDFTSITGGVADVNLAADPILIPNQWNHIAAIRGWNREYNKVAICYNGVAVKTFVADPFTLYSGGQLYIGKYPPGTTYDVTGYIDMVRISKGIARWIDDFDPYEEAYPVSQWREVKGVWRKEDDSWRKIQIPFYPKNINYSISFNQDDDNYLTNGNMSDDGDPLKWTFSTWVKRSDENRSQLIFRSPQTSIEHDSIELQNKSGNVSFIVYDDFGSPNVVYKADATSDMLQDNSNWFHIVVQYDSANSEYYERVKIFINGSKVRIFEGPGFYQGRPSYFNQDYVHQIGQANYTTCYLSDVYFVDGILVDPSEFGEEKQGVWVPKKYTGSYGSYNGFHLDFEDENDLGKDVSGEGNHFTENGTFTNHQVPDSPVNNYCTLNPSVGLYANFSHDNFRNSGLKFLASGASSWDAAYGTFVLRSGKWYYEATWDTKDYSLQVGFIERSTINNDDDPAHMALSSYASGTWGIDCRVQDSIEDGTIGTSWGAGLSEGDIVGLALDIDNGTLDVYVNGSHQGQITGLPTDEYYIPAVAVNDTNDVVTVDFGQFGFTYTPPDGYKSLCSENLPDLSGPWEIFKTCGTEDDYDSGTYVGNGDADQDGTFVYVGFRPIDVCIDGDHYNKWSGQIYIMSNGFKLVNGTTKNVDGTSYAWEAWVDQDFKHSNCKTQVAPS